jgi:hypothetical protein
MKDALGHGSNGRGYRGKYPNRLNEIAGHKRGTVRVRTNAGEKFFIHAKDTGGVMPKLGSDISTHPYAERISDNASAATSLASGPKSAPAPVHDSMANKRDARLAKNEEIRTANRQRMAANAKKPKVFMTGYAMNGKGS